MGSGTLRLERIILPLALAALAALSACVRSGPPAPVIMGGTEAGTEPGSSAGTHVAASEPTPAPPPPAAPQPAAQKPAAPAPALPVAAPQSHRAHPAQIVLAPGETLYMVSRRYDVPLRSIIDANHLEAPYRLAAGTRLKLPQIQFHVVQAGETLYAISRLYGVEVSTLASVNRLREPFGIKTGETLYLPPAVTAPERTASLTPPPQPEVAPAPSPSASAPASSRSAPPPAKPQPEQARLQPPAASKPSAGHDFAWPLQGRILESYGTGPAGTHNDGINIAARAGEPVRAADGGVVAYAGNELRGYGNLVLIKHSGGYMTAYAHNGKLLVKRGQAVKRGQEIARAGSTGSVGAPQLHFEIRRGTRALDPTDFLPALRASAN
jgi:murein DD-endopeptidase MepM/ murein hydrolase activator NlpD